MNERQQWSGSWTRNAGGSGHRSRPFNLSLDFHSRPRIVSILRPFCKNIETRLIRRYNSPREAASHIQEDLMANLLEQSPTYRAHFVALDIR
jgi:hypothetical protein